VISKLADRRPILFVLLVIPCFFLLEFAFVRVNEFFSSPSRSSTEIDISTSLYIVIFFLLLAFSLGWIRGLKLTRFGSRVAWGITFLLVFYESLYRFYAYFGDVQFELGWFFDIDDVGGMLIYFLIAGFLEEILCRGFMLFVLVREWGDTNHGLVVAVFVQAALFGIAHAVGAESETQHVDTLAHVMMAFYSGLLLGILVIRSGSLWPAVVLHSSSNILVTVKFLFTSSEGQTTLGNFWTMLILLPPILVGFASILKVEEPIPVYSPRLSDPRDVFKCICVGRLMFLWEPLAEIY
jgi:membrane protease YdiL (CAAX protease family)